MRAGFPYFNPHSFRSTLARLGEKVCRNAEDLKAWSQKRLLIDLRKSHPEGSSGAYTTPAVSRS